MATMHLQPVCQWSPRLNFPKQNAYTDVLKDRTGKQQRRFNPDSADRHPTRLEASKSVAKDAAAITLILHCPHPYSNSWKTAPKPNCRGPVGRRRFQSCGGAARLDWASPRSRQCHPPPGEVGVVRVDAPTGVPVGPSGSASWVAGRREQWPARGVVVLRHRVVSWDTAAGCNRLRCAYPRTSQIVDGVADSGPTPHHLNDNVHQEQIRPNIVCSA